MGQWKREEMDQVKEEEVAIMEYAAKKRATQGAWEAKTQAEADFKDRMHAEIAAEIQKKEREREGLEDIRRRLLWRRRRSACGVRRKVRG